MTITLLDLLGPQGMDAILQAMADRRLAHLPDSGAVGRLQLFPVDDMESFLLRGAVAKSLTVSINGRPVDLELMGVLRKERLRPLTLRKLMRQGASLVLNDLDRHLPQLWDLACDAERRFQDRVRIVAVGSFSRMPVFTAHYDPWDLIIIQIEGTKTWNLLGEPADCGVRNHPRVAVPAEVSATVEMRPGDILFVPAGLHHQCVGETFSLHLSLAIERATVRNVIEDLFSRLPALNRPFRAVLGPEALKRQVESIREEIVAQLGEMDVAAWLGNWNAARGRLTRLDLRGGEDGAAGPDALASLAITMVPDGETAERWKFGGTVLEPSHGAQAVLQALREGPRPVRDLIDAISVDVGPDGARDGLEVLVAQGVVHLDPTAEARAPDAGPTPAG